MLIACTVLTAQDTKTFQTQRTDGRVLPPPTPTDRAACSASCGVEDADHTRPTSRGDALFSTRAYDTAIADVCTWQDLPFRVTTGKKDHLRRRRSWNSCPTWAAWQPDKRSLCPGRVRETMVVEVCIHPISSEGISRSGVVQYQHRSISQYLFGVAPRRVAASQTTARSTTCLNFHDLIQYQ